MKTKEAKLTGAFGEPAAHYGKKVVNAKVPLANPWAWSPELEEPLVPYASAVCILKGIGCESGTSPADHLMTVLRQKSGLPSAVEVPGTARLVQQLKKAISLQSDFASVGLWAASGESWATRVAGFPPSSQQSDGGNHSDGGGGDSGGDSGGHWWGHS